MTTTHHQDLNTVEAANHTLAKFVRDFRSDPERLAQAKAVQAEFVALAKEITPEAIALASMEAPGANTSLAAALAELREELVQPLNVMREIGARIKAAAIADAERLRPLVFAACNREMEVARRLADIPGAVRSSESVLKDAYQRYINAGLRAEEADRLTADTREQVDANVAALQTEQAALEIELAALVRFRNSGDTADLPEGVTVPAPIEKVRFSGYAG